jgi:hypothetical protein
LAHRRQDRGDDDARARRDQLYDRRRDAPTAVSAAVPAATVTACASSAAAAGMSYPAARSRLGLRERRLGAAGFAARRTSAAADRAAAASELSDYSAGARLGLREWRLGAAG